MTLTRRDLLGIGVLGSITLLSACDAPASSLPSGPTPVATDQPTSPAPQSSLDPRQVPTPRYTTTPPDESAASISGNSLDKRFAGLAAYTGGALRTIRIKPGTYVRKTPIKIPSGVRLIAAGATFTSHVPGAQIALVEIKGVTDVVIEGGTWDGNKAFSTDKSQWKHVIQLINATRITLNGLITRNANGDGIYVGTHNTPCRDVTIKSVKSTRNGRNGMSITSCIGLTCTDSIFTANGDLSPRAGVDLEPNTADAPMRDLKFVRCAFTKNGSRGFLVVMQRASPDIKDGIQLVDCTIDRNANPWGGTSLCAGLVLIRPRGILISGGTISRNHTGILVQGRRGSDPKGAPRQGTVRLVDVDVHHSNREGLIVISGIKRLDAEQVRFFDNSREDSGYFSGIMLAQGSNMNFTDCVSTGSRMYGLQASDPVKKVTLLRCDLRGNGRGQLDTGDAGVKVLK